MMDSMGDDAVVATNDDAALCKFQAVSRGYYKDNFIGQFLSARLKSSSARKAPEINRGYYARSASIAYLVEQYIKANSFCQIISLGAGYDSLFWRLESNKYLQDDKEAAPSFKYVEIDMSVVTIHKITAIRRHQDLMKPLTSIKYKGEGLQSDNYHLLAFDLRQVEKNSLESKLLNECGLDFSKPTLCIAECVLVYMPSQDSNSLLSWFSDNFTNLTILNYEQCNMEDRFGDIMLAHMNARHCDLMGVEACKSLDSQTTRFKANGFEHTRAWTLSEVFNKFLLPSEIERIEKIEFLDEKELLEQLLHHYCIVVASKNKLDWITNEQYWLAETL